MQFNQSESSSSSGSEFSYHDPASDHYDDVDEHVSAEGKSTSTRVQHGERTDVRGYVNKYRATVRASGHEPITEQFDNDTQVQWLFNQVERSLGSA